jgi:Zn finger protein HypA/HybF involved in hydrogenase expression
MFLDQDEEADHYAQYEYENKPYDVKCRSCGWFDEGSQMDLELKGWALSPKGEICPKCASALLKLSEAISNESISDAGTTTGSGHSVQADPLPF